MSAIELTLWPTGPTARATDPPTSLAAVPSQLHRTDLQQRILRLHRAADGLTDAAVVAALPEYLAGSVVKRASELRAAGLLVDSGRRGPTPSGRSAIVWKVAP